MSKTLRTKSDAIKYLAEMGHLACDRIEHLETELAEARAEIERLALEIENKQYTITCASEENQQLKESLAEARADAEHWKSECNALQRMVHEARAEIDRLQGKENEADALLRKCLHLLEEQVERGGV